MQAKRMAIAATFFLLCHAAWQPAMAATPDFTCLNTGFLPNKVTPSLPFYQPNVQPQDAGSIVKVWPDVNRFNVVNGWNSSPTTQLTGVKSWWSGIYSAVPYQGANAVLMQWGTQDAYGHSAELVQGKTVGLWLNSMDSDLKLSQQGGSGSMNMGCWYNLPPYAPLFTDTNSAVDISFNASVGLDGSMGNQAHTQAYFNMSVRDRQCVAVHGNADCGLNINVKIYNPSASYANFFSIFPDTTGTAPFEIVDSGIDSPSTTQPWFVKMADSAGYQTRPFQNAHFHIQIPASGFAALLKQARTTLPNISLNPTDYDILTLNVIGEGYDPCHDASQTMTQPCTQHAQLGMAVSGFRVTATIPHQALAGGATLYNDWATRVAFVGLDQSIYVMSWNPQTGSYSAPFTVGTKAVSPPFGYDAKNATRMLYLDSKRHVHESFYTTSWQDWDMSGVMPPNVPQSNILAASNPFAVLDASGYPHVIFKTDDGHLHDIVMTEKGWVASDLTALTHADPAASSPSGVYAQNALRVDYRTASNRMIELALVNGKWLAYGISDAAHVDSVAGDPVTVRDRINQTRLFFPGSDGILRSIYLDASGAWLTKKLPSAKTVGRPAVYTLNNMTAAVYLDTNGDIHQLADNAGIWSDVDLTSTVNGALPAVNNPTAVVGLDNIPRIIYTASDKKLHEFQWRNAQWYHRDL